MIKRQNKKKERWQVIVWQDKVDAVKSVLRHK